MYSIFLLLFIAPVMAASDQGNSSLAQSSNSSVSEEVLDEILMSGSIPEKELDEILFDLQLMPKKPAKVQGEKESKTRKRKQGKSGFSTIAVSQHVCSPGLCIKKQCPSFDVSDEEWENEVVDMRNVQHFDVSGNYLIALPIHNDQFKDLKILCLSNNCFKGNGPDLRQLVSLAYLDLGHNGIEVFDPQTTLPKDCLEDINLADNRIHAIVFNGNWRMKPRTFNRLELANNPLSRECFEQLNSQIAGDESSYFLGLRGTRHSVAGIVSTIGINPEKLAGAFPNGGGIELGRSPKFSTSELRAFKRCLNPINATIANGGINPVRFFSQNKSIQQQFPQCPPYYCDSVRSIQLSDLTTGSSSSMSTSLANFHDMSAMLNPEEELHMGSSARDTSASSPVMSIDRILNPVSSGEELADSLFNSDDSADGLLCADQNSSDSTLSELDMGSSRCCAFMSMDRMLNPVVSPELEEELADSRFNSEDSADGVLCAGPNSSDSTLERPLKIRRIREAWEVAGAAQALLLLQSKSSQ